MFYFGVDYYPEHWPQERWPKDARLMAEAGFNVARLAEFAWSRMEPQDGQFDFKWLDRAISILAARDMQVVLGTPTASPPPWLMAKQTDLFRVRDDGQRLTFGNRRAYCPNNPTYHEHTRRIVEKMAGHYADNPAVIGWQIDNEFGERCYCDICGREFQKWLQARYGSLDELNARWGTVFWSHAYTDWSQIPTPRTTGHSPNPGLALDFYRFASDSYVAYQKLQMDILRAGCPNHFITHNLMGFNYQFLNYFDLARDLDFVSWDIYWRTQWNMQAKTDPSWAALGHDTMRGLKRKNYWVMEQQSGPGGWEIVSVPPRPGELRLWAYQSIAHGADGIVFFRWRTARFGTEQYWHGVLDHHGQPGRRYQEIKGMGREIKACGDQIEGSLVKPAVAMMLSYDSRFAFQIQGNNPRFGYPGHFHDLYRAFYGQQVPVDIVSPTHDLSNYQILVAPALHVLPDAVAKNLERFVEAGGLLVVTPRTGVKDEANALVNHVLPGLLAELCGVEVQEYVSMPVDEDGELEFTLPGLACTPLVASVWCDVLKPNGARVIARYTQGYFAGKPAITLNHYGKGKVVYVGTMGETPLYDTLAAWMLELAGVKPLLYAPHGVEVNERRHGDQRLLFVLNHTDDVKEIALDGRYADLLHDSETIAGTVTLAPRDVLVLAQKRVQ
jgi:beta-galactosidase